MSEIQRLMDQVAAFPNDEAVGLALSYGSAFPAFGYNVVRPGEPAHLVKTHLYTILSFCAMTFGSNIDLKKIREEIFGPPVDNLSASHG